MPIRFKCDQCGKTGEMPDNKAGHIVVCPSCGSGIELATVEWATPPPFNPPRSLPIVAKQSWWPTESTVWKLILAVSVIAFLFNLRTPPGPSVALHCIGLMLAVGMLAEKYARRFTPTWSIGVAIVAAVALAFLWGHWDYYIERWEKPTADGKGRIEYTDYVCRGNCRLYYREVWVWLEKGESHSEGGFSESGKQHGEWKTWAAPDYTTISKWYWYGEPVSEGDWHLRERK